MMTQLSDAILPMLRTRRDVWKWDVANEHGDQMHAAVDLLQQMMSASDPKDVDDVVRKGIASALKLLLRADDSSGFIGDACVRLIELRPITAARAGVSPTKLVEWMMAFEFENDAGFFHLDPVAYAPGLGEKGMADLRGRLQEVADRIGPLPPGVDRWSARDHASERFVLECYAKRFAVFDRDVDAIIRTHAAEQRVAAQLEWTAEAFEEICMVDLAIEWAERAVHHDHGHQALGASERWCRLLANHRPADELAARAEVFTRWPNAVTAAHLHDCAGDAWPTYRDEVLDTLITTSVQDAVRFVQTTLKDVPYAWELAHTGDLRDHGTWTSLAKAYEKVDPLAVIPVWRDLVERELSEAKVRNYHIAAEHLGRMRRLAGSDGDAQREVHEYVAELRERYKRRPRMLEAFARRGF